MKLRDTLERLFWTVIAAFLGALAVGPAVNISTFDAGVTAAASAGVNFVLLVARTRLAVLPEPGAGLPGLSTEEKGASNVELAALCFLSGFAVVSTFLLAVR